MVEADREGFPIARYKDIPEIKTTDNKPSRMPVIDFVDDDKLQEFVFLENYPFNIRSSEGMRLAAGYGALVSTLLSTHVRFGSRVETGRINDTLDIVPLSDQTGVGLYLERSRLIVTLAGMELWLKRRDLDKLMSDFTEATNTPEKQTKYRLLAIESVSLLPKVHPS